MKIFDQYGILRNIDHIRAADRLIDLKKKSGSNPWPVIEECIKVFEKQKPHHYKSHVIYLKNIRETRKDKKFASTTDKVTGGILRYTIDIPETVMFLIRKLYTPDELPMNKDFFHAFGRKFPNYMVAEKL